MRFKSWREIDDPDRRTTSDAVLEIARTLTEKLEIFASMPAAEDEELAGDLALLPFAAKDMLAAPGHSPACGFAGPLKRLVDGREARVLEVLRRNGARRVGFTNMTTLAYEPSGFNALRPFPKNPWDPERITGASSSGSGVAAAAGCAFLAIGSDTGGSVRIPAACCGVTGWKPTYGIVPAEGAMVLAEGLDTLGFLARDAVDIQFVAPVVAERTTLPEKAAPPARALVFADVLATADPIVARACREALDALESRGVQIEKRDGARALDILDVPTLAIMQAGVSRRYRWLIASGKADSGLERRLQKGLEITDEDVARHERARRRYLRDFLEAFLPEDTCLVMPTLPIRTPAWPEVTPGAAVFSPRVLYQLSRNTRFANYLGLPAVSAPAGFDDRDMPIGIQLLGRPEADAVLLAAAASMQSVTDWHGRVPTASTEAARQHAILLSSPASAEKDAIKEAHRRSPDGVPPDALKDSKGQAGG